jgi:hypothetical protein
LRCAILNPERFWRSLRWRKWLVFKTVRLRNIILSMYYNILNIYCSELRVRHIRRTYSSPAGMFIQEQCSMIRGRLMRRRKKRAQPAQMSVTQERIDWARQREQSTAARAGKQCLQSGGRDGTKSEAERRAGQRALQRLTSLPRAASSFIASLKRQRAQRSFRLGLGGSAFGGFLPL